MPDKALESTTGSIECVTNIALQATGTGRAKALAEFAQKYKFESFGQLHQFLEESAVLVDRHTAVFVRELPTDQTSAWEFIANPQKLKTWMFDAEFDAAPGADFNFAPEGWHGKIGVFEEGRELRFDAVKGGWTWFSLESVNGSTLLTLRDYMAPNLVIPDEIRSGSDAKSLAADQPGGSGTHWQGVLAGWHTGVDDLRGLFSGNKPQWDYAALYELYKLLILDYHRSY